MREGHELRLTLVLAACVVAVVVMAATLRPDAFFVGDQGVKLAATRNAIQFPLHPFDIPLPSVAGEPVPLVEPFFIVHGAHTHAITSELFPLLSAPLLVLLGMRGLYVLPALGLFATVLATGWLAAVLDVRRDAALAAAAAAVGTPFLFYGLEFWEHMPATALAATGAAWLLAASRSRPGRHAASPHAFTAGLCFGAAIVLRTEMACFVVATALASRMLVHRPSWRSLGIAACGVLVTLVPTTIYDLLHFGSLVPEHVRMNAGLVGQGWWAQRLQIAAEWFVPSPWTLDGPAAGASIWNAAPVALVALAGAFRPSELREGGVLWVMAAGTLLLMLITAPNGGGSQWGPRYLLPMFVPLSILGAGVFQELPRGWARGATWVGMLLLCVWVQRAAYRELRGTKVLHGRLADFVGRTASLGVPVVSDLWWLDQLAQPALDGRTFIYADRAQTGRDVVRRLSDRTVPTTTVYRSRESSGDVDSWSAGTCYFEEAREELDVRGLIAIRLRHRCGYVAGSP